MEASKCVRNMLFLFGVIAVAVDDCERGQLCEDSALLQVSPGGESAEQQDADPEPAMDIETSGGMVKYQDEWFPSKEDKCYWKSGFCGADNYIDIVKTTFKGCRRACAENYHCQGVTYAGYSRGYYKKTCRLILDSFRSKPCLECVRVEDACAKLVRNQSGKTCKATDDGHCDWIASNLDSLNVNMFPDANCSVFNHTQIFKYKNNLDKKFNVGVNTCTTSGGTGFSTSLAVYTADKYGNCVPLDCSVDAGEGICPGMPERSFVSFVAKPHKTYYIAQMPVNGIVNSTAEETVPIEVTQDKVSYRKFSGKYLKSKIAYTRPYLKNPYKKKNACKAFEDSGSLSGTCCKPGIANCGWKASNSDSLNVNMPLPEPDCFDFNNSQLFKYFNNKHHKYNVTVSTCNSQAGFNTSLAVWRTNEIGKCVPFKCNVDFVSAECNASVGRSFVDFIAEPHMTYYIAQKPTDGTVSQENATEIDIEVVSTKVVDAKKTKSHYSYR